MKRSFASLTAQEALHVAIFIEERNAEIYQQFAELFAGFKDTQSLQVARTFLEMASEERHHGTLLQDRYFERYGTQPCAVTEDDIREFIEVPRLDGGELFAITRSSAALSLRHMALEVALKAELSAQRYYTRLAEITSDTRMAAFYRELSEFEDGHTAALQRELEAARRAAGRSEVA